ncbi:hypothetical protein D5086_023907 [Populus alba]|uniref:Uncharacterized protein n=2 Tax=Populus TaxID=3689 RepID=A0ACC4BBR5_POPAL|nr:hypothetical protein NC653_029993 [Populus alba x Populus x berolinensis]
MISMNQTTQNEHIRYHEEADDDLFIAEVTEHNKGKTSKHSMRRGECSYCSLFKIESPNTPEQKLRMLLRRLEIFMKKPIGSILKNEKILNDIQWENKNCGSNIFQKVQELADENS